MLAILAQPSSQQPHALVALPTEQGSGLGASAAWGLVAKTGCRFETNDPVALVEAAHRNGGVYLLAHPGHGDGFVTFDTALLDEFRREAPIDGLEAYYPLHTPAQTAIFAEYARRHARSHALTSTGEMVCWTLPIRTRGRTRQRG